MHKDPRTKRHCFTIVTYVGIYEGHELARCEVSYRMNDDSFTIVDAEMVAIEDLACTGWNGLADAQATALVEASRQLENEATWTHQHRLTLD
jgi:hypothetical protein